MELHIGPYDIPKDYKDAYIGPCGDEEFQDELGVCEWVNLWICGVLMCLRTLNCKGVTVWSLSVDNCLEVKCWKDKCHCEGCLLTFILDFKFICQFLDLYNPLYFFLVQM